MRTETGLTKSKHREKERLAMYAKCKADVKWKESTKKHRTAKQTKTNKNRFKPLKI